MQLELLLEKLTDIAIKQMGLIQAFGWQASYTTHSAVRLSGLCYCGKTLIVASTEVTGKENQYMDGVIVVKDNDSCAFYIERFSDMLKDAIRQNLASICHGPADVATGRPMFSYKATLIEFVKRYNDKTEKQKKGLIGELILHVLLHELLDEYAVDSPFFNNEERNVKKGFDVVLNKRGTNELWITEVKSGNLHLGKNATQTIVGLINTAKVDLNGRLNADSISLWLNAIAGAKKALDNNPDKKRAIVSILEDNGDAATEGTLCSTDMNVILVGTLFHNTSDRFSSYVVSEKKRRIDRENIFNATYVIAIQEKTYTAIFDFLERESRS